MNIVDFVLFARTEKCNVLCPGDFEALGCFFFLKTVGFACVGVYDSPFGQKDRRITHTHTHTHTQVSHAVVLTAL